MCPDTRFITKRELDRDCRPEATPAIRRARPAAAGPSSLRSSDPAAAGRARQGRAAHAGQRSVTHVPGQKCYPCPWLHKLSLWDRLC